MVHKLFLHGLFFGIILSLVSSCAPNHHGSNGQGSTLSITSPNNGISFRTKEKASFTIAGICERGVEVALATVPSRPVVNNCATDGTWSFESGTLSSGDNTFSVAANDIAHVSITATADLAQSMAIRANKAIINTAVDNTANLHVAFFDEDGAEIVIPEATSDHLIEWTVVSSDATVAAASDSPSSGEKEIVSVTSGDSVTIHAHLDSIIGTYDYPTDQRDAEITIPVTSEAAGTIPGVAATMTVTADKTTINIGGTANLQVHFFDAFGAEIVIPNATSSHDILWTSDDPYVSFTEVTPPTSHEKTLITGVAGGTTNINVQLIGLDSSYGFTGSKTASKQITVNGQNTPKVLTMSHLAGSVGGPGSDDGIGANASFWAPFAVTTDGANLYVADTFNHTIRKIVISTGVVTTLAGTVGVVGHSDGTGANASFVSPEGITTDGTNLYVTDVADSVIRKIVISTGVVTTFAGNHIGTRKDGIGTNAGISMPIGITTDGTNLYVADWGDQYIRKIVIATAEVTTIAGPFNGPTGITTDGTNLYVADYSNSTIDKVVISSGVVTTLAGTPGVSGSDDSSDGTGASASFNSPWGIATDGANLYVADSLNETIRKIVISTGEVTTFAGSAGVYGSTDGIGSNARFSSIMDITTDRLGNLYAADVGNNTIRKIVISTAEVTTFAGTAIVFGSSNGIGSKASFDYPQGIAVVGTNLYVADGGNNTIRKIVIATGAVTTLAGNGDPNGGSNDDTGINASFACPSDITTDGAGNLYVTDSCNNTIRKIVISTGAVTTIAGTAGVIGSSDGPGLTIASFNYPDGITTDGTNLYVADNGNSTIRKVVISTGEVSTLAGSAGVFGSSNGTGPAASFMYPTGITSDGTNLYVTDCGNNTIRKIVIATGAVTTLAGNGDPNGGSNDGTGINASFVSPIGITTDGTNLYVADNGNNTIRKIVISTGAVTTFAGITGRFGHKDGTLDIATFYQPVDIYFVAGKFFISEGNNDIREIQ